MLNGVSNVSFSAGVFDRPALNAPQTFTRPNAPDTVEVPKKKKGKKALGWILGAAAVIAGLVVGAKTGAFNKVGNIIPKGIKNASWLQWAKNPTKAAMKGLDTAGNWLASVPSKVAGLFSKKAAPTP